MLILAGCQSDTSLKQKKELENDSRIFIDITEKSKLNFVHDPGVDGSYFMPESLGSGCALFDYDNDGDLDVLLLNAGSHNKGAGAGGTPALHRQERDGTFTNVTESAGLTETGYGMGAAVGDIDNDGNLDLFITTYGPEVLYRNNGNGTFTDITKQAGTSDDEWSTSAMFLDYDRDGFLDLYATNYLQYDPNVHCSDKAGRPEYCGPKIFSGVSDRLYHNNRNATFTDVSVKSGIASVPMKGLGIVSGDFNNDSYPDIYAANDGEPNLLWINQKDGTFQDHAVALGAAVNGLGQPEGSMGVAAGDADEDGDLDLFMTVLHDEKIQFFRNERELGFVDDSLASGLAGPSAPFTGFGAGFFDYDNDGDLDVAVVNGRIERGPLLIQKDAPDYWDHYSEPNMLFENVAGRYRDVSKYAGNFGSDLKTSRGLAFGDVDNDGDIDLLVTNTGAGAQLFRNDVSAKGHWLIVRAIDGALKRDAIGAVITVDAGGKKIVRIAQPGYSYLSSNDPRVHFGLGVATSVDRILIRWPDGKQEVFPATRADQFITLTKGSGK